MARFLASPRSTHQPRPTTPRKATRKARPRNALAGIHSPNRKLTPTIIGIRPWPVPGQRPCHLPFTTTINLNLIDLVIIVALLIGLANGYRRGFWLSLFQYAGLVVGVVAGAALAPVFLDFLHLTGNVRPIAAVLFLIICGSLGSTAGYWVGEPIRRSVRGTGGTGTFEAVCGSAFSLFSVLSVAWFLGLTFSQGPSPEVGRLIQQSAILRTVDSVFPRPPGFMSGARTILAGVPFPQTFAGLEPTLPPPLQPPASVNTPGVQAATAAVYRVEGRGCGGVVSGSAYPIARGYLVTNAHVVSGTTNTTLSQDATRVGGIRASVVLFDPQRDVAILYAPQVTAGTLPEGPGSRGTSAAVIGYPGGGAETVSPAVLDQSIQASGRDIYNDTLVNRSIWVLTATVRPGNSGGPVVDLQGHVLGLVFAASSTTQDQAYALTNEEIQPDVQAGIGRTLRIDTSTYRCAV
jgi:S1-C subfamily serine protease